MFAVQRRHPARQTRPESTPGAFLAKKHLFQKHLQSNCSKAPATSNDIAVCIYIYFCLASCITLPHFLFFYFWREFQRLHTAKKIVRNVVEAPRPESTPGALFGLKHLFQKHLQSTCSKAPATTKKNK